MSKRFQKSIFTAMSVLLIIGMVALTGCSSKKEDESTSASPISSTAATDNAATAAPEATAAEPPVEITMSAPAFEKSFPAGFQDDPVTKEIEKKLNIKLNITPANAVGDVNAKFAAQLASGDLPDLNWVPTPDLLPKVITANAALAVDDLLTKYGTDITANAPFRIDYSKQFLSKDINGKVDGKTYFVTLGGDTSDDPLQAQVAPYLRYDLWKKLGFPKLDTMDDYLTVLKQMQELEPTNAKGEKNYGVGAWFADAPGWAQWSLETPFSFFEGVAANGSYDLDMVTNKVIPRLTDLNSTFWKGIDWYQKANQMGLLDPDSFTMKFADYLNKAAANRVFLGWAPWAIDNGNLAFTKDGHTDQGFYQMPAPNKLDQYLISFDAPQGAQMYFISKNSKHPEKAMELLNYLISYEGSELIFNGVKGTHWDEVDGKPVIKPEVIQGIKDDPDYKIKTGIYKYHNIAGRGPSIIDPKYNVPIYFNYLPEIVKARLTPLQQEADTHFNVELPGDLYRGTKKYTAYDTSIVAVLPVMPDDLKAMNTKITTYVQTNQVKLVSIKDAAKYQAAKETFLKEVKELGSDKLVAWYTTEIAKIVESRKK